MKRCDEDAKVFLDIGNTFLYGFEAEIVLQ
jgi:hypothetical protein